MSSTRSKLSLVVVGCALVLTPCGCRAPWSGSGDNSRAGAASAIPTFLRPAPASTSPAIDAISASQRTDSASAPADAPALAASLAAPAAAAEPDLAGVLEKLQEVGELDPAAQAKLIEKLQSTKPEFWPLVAEQFRASLAYHKQLIAREPAAARDGGAPATDRTASRDVGPSPSSGRSRAGAVTVPVARQPDALPTTTESPSPPLSAAGRPSAPIGALVDPRSMKPDATPDDLLAQSPPDQLLPAGDASVGSVAGEPAAPREFAAQGAVYPISGAARADGITHAVLTASLDEPVDANAKPRAPGTAPGANVEPRDNWQRLVTQAAEDLSRRVAASPTTTAEIHQHVSLRILRLLTGDTEKALEPIPHISPVEQDYWSRQLFALATLMDHHTQPDDKRRAAASVVHLDEAAANLHELGSLALRNLTFCKEVFDYGAYEPYEHDHFAPGQKLTLYVEVENFHSQSTEKGFRTSLGSTYELLNEDGNRVDSGEFPDIEDCCRSRRRDFHVQYGLALPKTLPPGKYQLQLVVRDRGSDKIGHTSVAFEVSGGKK